MKSNKARGEVLSTTRIRACPNKRKELALTVSSLLHLIRCEKGCRTFGFFGDIEDHDLFILIGEWEDRVALELHLESETFQILLGSLRLLCDQSDIDFKLLSSVGGNELLIRRNVISTGRANVVRKET